MAAYVPQPTSLPTPVAPTGGPRSLQAPPQGGGPMGFGPPPGGQMMGPRTALAASGSGGYNYAPNRFSGQMPAGGPPIQGGNQMTPQQVLIQSLRNRPQRGNRV